MESLADLTVSQKILLASHKLEEAGHTPFTAEALVVQAWKDSPRTFGLRGFESEYPDSNKALSTVMGERGLARRGWLVKVGQKLYNLSRQGKEEVKRILAGDDSPLPKRRALAKIQVPNYLEDLLVWSFCCTAFRRFEEGMKLQITYRDACQFWRLPADAVGQSVDNYLAIVPSSIKSVLDLLIGDKIELSNGQEVTEKDLKELLKTHDFLLTHFARNLEQQRKRFQRLY